MTVSFENPPLVELIAELKWLPRGASVSGDDPDNINVPASLFAPGIGDEFFMRFASLIGAQGFTHSQRLLPPAMPAIPFQPVYRYSKSGGKAGSTVFQLGSGLFSAHITPPYKSWGDFRPFLVEGVKALLEARPEPEKDATFSSVLVRYIDCFTTRFSGDASTRRFLEEKLGVSVKIPKSIEDRVAAGKDFVPSLKVAMPLANGSSLTFAFATGKIGAFSGVLMDSSAQSAKAVSPNLEAVMSFLDDAHRIISDCFVELTTSLHDVMGISK